MNEKELFNEVLKFFTEQYNLTVERPYSGGYIVIFDKNNNEILSFNSSGYNLLYNLFNLCDAIRRNLE